MGFADILCRHCSTPISREHTDTYLFSCGSCNTITSTDPSVETASLSGKKIQSPSVLSGKNTATINGTFYHIKGSLVLYTTSITRMVYLLASNTGGLFYLFECNGSFYLGGDEPFVMEMKKPHAGSELKHNNVKYTVSSVERVDAALVNGEVKFPAKGLLKTYLLFTFEKQKQVLLATVNGKEKNGLLLAPVDPEKISVTR